MNTMYYVDLSNYDPTFEFYMSSWLFYFILSIAVPESIIPKILLGLNIFIAVIYIYDKINTFFTKRKEDKISRQRYLEIEKELRGIKKIVPRDTYN